MKLAGVEGYSHCAIALRRNCSIDFYFNYRNVETKHSNMDEKKKNGEDKPAEVYLDIDLDFDKFYFRSLSLNKHKKAVLTNYRG